MLVYRIALIQYADALNASGRAARWNPNDTQVIYTSSSRSLACLENIVHRSQLGLNQLYNVMTIEVDDRVKIKEILSKDLPEDWREFTSLYKTQKIGAEWLSENQCCLLKVPSAIIEGEFNFLINPQHSDFKFISLQRTEPFVFDPRFKQ